MASSIRTLLGRAVGCVALLAFGLSLAAWANPAPAPKPDKKDQDKKAEPARPADGRAADPAPGAANDGDPARIRDEMRRRLEEAQRRGVLVMPVGPGPGGVMGEVRLGVRASRPSDALADQLDLPRGQGLVVDDVEPDSAAARAGLKPHDVLLEFNGKPVPDDVRQFAGQLHDVKAGTPVDALVLRKGKRETIKGVKLPEARRAEAGGGNIQIPFPLGPLMPKVGAAAADGVAALSTVRTGDEFTTRYQEGELAITVKGSVADGKTKVKEITVRDGGKTEKYESVDKVPERFRDKVKDVIESAEKSGFRIEFRVP